MPGSQNCSTNSHGKSREGVFRVFDAWCLFGNWTYQNRHVVEFCVITLTVTVACRTGGIFCVFWANGGERGARVAREGRSDFFSAPLLSRNSHFALASRSPCSRLYSPRIRKKFRLFCRLVTVSSRQNARQSKSSNHSPEFLDLLKI